MASSRLDTCGQSLRSAPLDDSSTRPAADEADQPFPRCVDAAATDSLQLRRSHSATRSGHSLASTDAFQRHALTALTVCSGAIIRQQCRCAACARLPRDALSAGQRLGHANRGKVASSQCALTLTSTRDQLHPVSLRTVRPLTALTTALPHSSAHRSHTSVTMSSSSSSASGRPAPAPLTAEEIKREEEWKADSESAFEEG